MKHVGYTAAMVDFKKWTDKQAKGDKLKKPSRVHQAAIDANNVILEELTTIAATQDHTLDLPTLIEAYTTEVMPADADPLPWSVQTLLDLARAV
jgi:hypothetical protein